MSHRTNLTKELHAILVRQLSSHLFMPQTASQLSTQYHSVHEALFLSTPEELKTLNGISNQSIRKILAFRELSHRIDLERSAKVKSFHHPKDIYNYLCDMRRLQQEQFRIVLLNAKNRIICQQLISQGTINASIVSPREVFHTATKYLALASLSPTTIPAVIVTSVKRICLSQNRWFPLGNCWKFRF